MPMRAVSSKQITFMLYPMSFAFAIFTTMQGVLLPILREEFSLALSQGGIFTVCVNLGSIAGITLSGLLLDRFNKIRSIMTAYALFGLSLLCVLFSQSYIAYLCMLIVVGGTGKFSDTGNSAAVSELNPVKRAFFMSLLHCCYAIGSFVGPLTTSLLVGANLPWRQTYMLLGILVLVLVAGFYTVARGAQALQKAPKVKQETVSFRSLCKPQLFLLMGVMIFYCGHQHSMNAWLPTYLQYRLGLAPVNASLGVSMFWVGLIVSRLSASVLSQKIAPRILVRVGCGAACLSLLLGVLGGTTGTMFAGVIGSGFFSGWTVPLTLTIGFGYFPKAQGKASMMMFLALSAGAMFCSWLMGVVSEFVSLDAAMCINAASLGVACLFACCIKKDVQAADV